jgi:hypothetical protein
MKKKFLIVIPYRDRQENLATLLPHLHWFLRKHHFEIAVIEQGDQRKFNKGFLCNVGYQMFRSKFDYFVFHDVDLIPLQGDYSFPKRPAHIATQLSQYGYRDLYPDHLYGVTAFRGEDFEKINGFSIRYRGWGVEDQDLKLRCRAAGLTAQRRKGRFISLPHPVKNSIFGESLKNWQRLEAHRRRDISAGGLEATSYRLKKRERRKSVPIFSPLWNQALPVPAPHHHIVVVEK